MVICHYGIGRPFGEVPVLVAPKTPDKLEDDGAKITMGLKMRKVSETKAFDLSIAVLRKAQGKGNPDDFVTGTPEWQKAQLGVMQDTMRIIGLLRSEMNETGR